jgi:hypothetical protein
VSYDCEDSLGNSVMFLKTIIKRLIGKSISVALALSLIWPCNLKVAAQQAQPAIGTPNIGTPAVGIPNIAAPNIGALNIRNPAMQIPPIQPTDVQPTPVEPTAVEPTEIQPTEIQPTAIYPTGIQPTAIEPTEIQSTAIHPTAIHPTFIPGTDTFSGAYLPLNAPLPQSNQAIQPHMRPFNLPTAADRIWRPVYSASQPSQIILRQAGFRMAPAFSNYNFPISITDSYGGATVTVQSTALGGGGWTGTYGDYLFQGALPAVGSPDNQPTIIQPTENQQTTDNQQANDNQQTTDNYSDIDNQLGTTAQQSDQAMQRFNQDVNSNGLTNALQGSAQENVALGQTMNNMESQAVSNDLQIMAAGVAAGAMAGGSIAAARLWRPVYSGMHIQQVPRSQLAPTHPWHNFPINMTASNGRASVNLRSSALGGGGWTGTSGGYTFSGGFPSVGH